MKKTIKPVLLCALIATNLCLAEQNEFDVKHYRIALSLDEDTQSFEGKTTVAFSSLVNDLHALDKNENATLVIGYAATGIGTDKSVGLDFRLESGLRTVHWRQTRQQPTYLHAFAASPPIACSSTP